MNLYIVGWNLPPKRHPMAVTELCRMTEVYPHLDPETLWHRSSTCGTLFTASMHTADQAAAPRNYVMQSDNQVVFYSGLPVNPTGAYPAHRAEALSAHWDQLTENLEGQYFTVRATDDPPHLELLNDILGMEQVFYLHQGDLWLVSNSVWLIERISGSRSLDPLGVSLFLSAGWVGADRTLRSDIRVIPGGQHWTWQEGDVEPRRQSYYPRSKLACQPRQALTPSYLKQLADDLTQPLRSLSQSFDNIECQLTGGRDSRLVAALMIHAGLPALYYTRGRPSADVETASLIARTFDLPYEFRRVTASEVIRGWDKACWQLVRQFDGMKTLKLISTWTQTPQIDRLKVTLWGAGGEMARGGLSRIKEPYFFLGRPDVAGMERYLARVIKDYGGLICQEGTAPARDYLHRFVMQCVDDGFALVDTPDVFYIYERHSRRSGNNARGMMLIGDRFSPYCTRASVEAVFAMPALQRYTEPLHYNLIRLLTPELHSLPFEKNPWCPQQPAMNLLHFGARVLRRAGRRIPNMLRRPNPQKSFNKTAESNQFEAIREQVREICLDQKDSLLWNFVDRSMFDRITSSATGPVDRSRYVQILYHIATLFYYEADDRRHTAPAIAQR